MYALLATVSDDFFFKDGLFPGLKLASVSGWPRGVHFRWFSPLKTHTEPFYPGLLQEYPSAQILAVLSRNRRIGEDLIADVIDQSADKLIDGVTSGMYTKRRS